MKANELRIGNWVLEPINGNKKVSPTGLCDFANEFCIFKPIQLTEEILLKCGFEKKGDRTYFYGKRFGFEIGIKSFFLQIEKHEAYTYVIRTEIYYLHQLQNLYFALTGEELNVNL